MEVFVKGDEIYVEVAVDFVMEGLY